MTDLLEVRFVPLDATRSPALVLLAGQDLAFGKETRRLVGRTQGGLERAAAAADFKGRARSSIELLAPEHLDASRLILLGSGQARDLKEADWINLGGVAYAQLAARKTEEASLLAEGPDAAAPAGHELAGMLAFGAVLRSYSFRKYRQREEEGDANNNANGPARLRRLNVLCSHPELASRAFERFSAIANGVFLARDLVNEPANILGPVDFADRLGALSATGLAIEVLDVEQLAALKMNALLGVAQGSDRPPRVVVMQWQGAKSKKAKPLCFIGKGVVFDTGGLSMKPAAGMEDMKGDMGGAACVAGLMQSLAARKANVNAVGLVGLVENMPSGKAQRPGDIVTSMSGQTIEVLNTDAEGRLVLADLLWYAQERFKPRFIVDLATLTGAIIIALGKEYAGMFSNDDRLAGELSEAGEAVGEKVWRMPLAKAYDKMIDSKNADMKNIGGRGAGAITAAQFLKRFVNETPWVHLDVAGTAMDSTRSDINQSWASGWGVRLLDRLVADRYEKADKPEK